LNGKGLLKVPLCDNAALRVVAILAKVSMNVVNEA
jgi:hypothetical protein